MFCCTKARSQTRTWSMTKSLQSGESPAMLPMAQMACSWTSSDDDPRSWTKMGTAPASMTILVCAEVPLAMLVSAQAASNWSVALLVVRRNSTNLGTIPEREAFELHQPFEENLYLKSASISFNTIRHFQAGLKEPGMNKEATKMCVVVVEQLWCTPQMRFESCQVLD